MSSRERDSQVNLRTRPEPHNTQYLEAMASYRFIRERVKGRKLLDAGSASGYGSAVMAEYASFVVGVDFDLAVLRWAAGKFRRPNLKFAASDLEALAFKDGCFDAICLFEVIHLVADYRKVLSEMSRVIKPEGKFYVTTRNWKDNLPANADSGHLHCFTREQLGGLFREYGFKVNEVYGISRPREAYLLEGELEKLRKMDLWGIRRFIPRALISYLVYAVSRSRGITPPQELPENYFEISRERLDGCPGVLLICSKTAGEIQ